jgi:APA family basic amino acid/polyamine antiporter
MTEPPAPAPIPTALPRTLGPWMAAAIVVGTVIGSGVFKKPQVVAERVPEFGPALLVWVLGGLLALLGALALAEIAVLLPRAGGNYAFLKEAYGRLFGFLWGWIDFWIIRSASLAALASMFAEGLHDVLRLSLGEAELLTFWQRQLLAAGTITTLAAVNSLGARVGGTLQVVVTVVKVGSILGIIVLPFAVLALVENPPHPPKLSNLGRVWPEDWSAFDIGKFGAALVGVLWAYHGWMNIGPVAEEVRAPQRNIPLSLLGGVTLLIVIYLGANVSYYLVIPRAEMAGVRDTAVSTEFALRLVGPVGAVLGSAALMLSVFGSLNGNILVGPRLLFAMARDRLAPRALAEVTASTQTPVVATAVLAGWSVLLVAGAAALTVYRLPTIGVGTRVLDLNVPPEMPLFDVLTGAISFETLVIASLFVFRRRYPVATVKLAYRCPGYPVVPALYVAVMACVLANMFATPDQVVVALVGVGFILVGVAVYVVLFARRG